MKNEKIEVQTRLRQVNELLFCLDNTILSTIEKIDENKLNIEIGFNARIDKETNFFILDIIIKYQYDLDNKIEKLLEYCCENVFEIKNINDVFILDNEGKIITDKCNFIAILIGISIGTVRGILLTKTAGSKLAGSLIPIIDPNELYARCQKNEK